MLTQEAEIEMIIDRLELNNALNTGSKVLIEGCFSDSTGLIGGEFVALKKDLPDDIDTINFDNFRFSRWPEGSLGQGRTVTLEYRDFHNLSLSSGLPGKRAFILEDGRIFVGEQHYANPDYLERILRPSIRIAQERFSQAE